MEDEVANALHLSIGLFLRRLRHTKQEIDGLSVPESSALSRLDRDGSAAPTELARAERISPQSMSVTIAGLELRGLVERHPDPADGRRAVLSITPAGLEMLRARRTATTRLVARGLEGFTADELAQLMAAAPLIERLAHRL
jgi:DNA-binding MarR family transcriptional regulator